MAIDTQNKRRSALFPLLPWLRVLPVADGDVDEGDRAAVAGLYSGVAAGAPAAPAASVLSLSQILKRIYDASNNALKLSGLGAASATVSFDVSEHRPLKAAYDSTKQKLKVTRV